MWLVRPEALACSRCLSLSRSASTQGAIMALTARENACTNGSLWFRPSRSSLMIATPWPSLSIRAGQFTVPNRYSVPTWFSYSNNWQSSTAVPDRMTRPLVRSSPRLVNSASRARFRVRVNG
ncbi:hypothetical protein D3C78_1544330 [compost metagenome]